MSPHADLRSNDAPVVVSHALRSDDAPVGVSLATSRQATTPTSQTPTAEVKPYARDVAADSDLYTTFILLQDFSALDSQNTITAKNRR